ncbi:AAA family ATPase [Psychrobacter aestuarii]|uniref:AAA family ATPase n=1 Tax=Psychrobacter aestuarii TaxID=556327 RepID=A0ABN0VQ30_9GAMM|nr:AAA family ATPase [Psychrobacter aestuarii]
MRLIELRLKNLNSLKGEWHIDFADPAFVNEGIFAITGQTGAGKTTILDAICLALYGETPRINSISKSSNEVMTRQTAECFAEVVIDLNGSHYRCRWGQRRAYNKADGNLQDATHEIAKLKHDDSSAEGVLLESSLKHTKNKIIELTGMDFQQFTRSILLAQGSFSAFLKAKADERADILEKITGTDIYATISKHVHEKKRAEEDKLKALQSVLEGLQLLDVDTERQLSADLQDYQHRQQGAQQTLKTLSEQLAWLDTVDALQEKLQSAQHDLQQAKRADQDFVADAARLDAATKALEIDSQYSQLTHTRTQLAQLSAEAAQMAHDLPEQQSRTQHAKAQLSAQQNKRNAAENALQSALPQIAAARKLDNEMTQQRYTLAETNSRHDTLQTDVETLRQTLTTYQQTLDDKQNQLGALTSKLAHAGELTQLDSDITNFDNQCSRLKSLLQQNATLADDKTRHTQQLDEQQSAFDKQQQQQAQLTARHSDAQTHINELQQSQDALTEVHAVAQMRVLLEHIDQTSYQLTQLYFHTEQRQTLTVQHAQNEEESAQLSEALAQVQARIDDINQEIDASKDKRQDKHNQLQLQQKVAALEHYIAELKDGHPCPLCGAHEHPYRNAHPNLVADSENMQLQQRIDTLDAHIAKCTADVTAATIEQAGKQSTLTGIHTQQEKIQAQIEQHASAIAALMDTLMPSARDRAQITSQTADTSTDPIDPLLQTLVQTLRHTEHDRDALTHIATSKDKLGAIKTRIKQDLVHYDELGARLTSARQTLTTIEASQHALASTLSQYQADISITNSALSAVNHQLAANFVELKTLQSDIVQRLHVYEGIDYQASARATLQRAEQDMQPLADSIDNERALSEADYHPHLEILREQRRALIALKQQFAEDQAAQHSLQSELERLRTHIDNKNAQLDKDAATLAQLAQTITERSDTLARLHKERTQAFAPTDIDAAERELRDTLTQAQEAQSSAQRQLDTAEHSTQQLITRQNALTEQITTVTQAQKTQETVFQNALCDSDFADEAAFIKARLPMDERNRLKSAQAHIDYALKQAQVLVDELTHTLAETTANPATTEDRDTLAHKHRAAQADVTQYAEHMGAISQQLKDNDAKKISQQTQLSAMATQKAALDIWLQLYKLIGSADGKKYRTFAQGLTFDIMIGHANKQLYKMSSRYLLTRDDEKPLELNVIDNHQGGEIRSTKNLSGGEGFIISLALALGLSQMASQNIRVDSLFLDEGFGTLDEESLDIALDTLTSLQQEGKLIGVISHIQALKDRILTQIKVEKRSGGFSRIEGAGCAQVAGG